MSEEDQWAGMDLGPEKPIEQVVPQCIESEREFLSTLLQPGWDAELYEFSLLCPPEFFHKPQHRIIWEGALKLVESGTECSFGSLATAIGANFPKLGGFQAYTDMISANPVLDVHVPLRDMRSKWEAREALKALEKAFKDVQFYGEVGSSLDELRGIADAIAPKETPIKSYSDLFEVMEAGYGSLPADKAANLPCFGVESLDNTVGAMAGTLGVVAAKTSAGKSSLAYQLCVQSAMKGRRVLLVSLEADREEVSAALAANINQVNRTALLRSGISGVSVDGIVKSNVMGYHAGSGATWDNLEKAIRIEHRKSPFNVIILDYFTLLEPPTYKGNRNMASLYGEISKGGKRLAQQLACSVIFLSQFNRGVEDGQEPFLENLRETGQLEQDADWVVLLWAKPEDEPEGFRYVNAKVAKNRKGKRGDKFKMKLYPAQSRFTGCETMFGI